MLSEPLARVDTKDFRWGPSMRLGARRKKVGWNSDSGVLGVVEFDRTQLEERELALEWEDIGVADLIKPEDDRENARNFIWGLVQQTKDRNKQNRVTVMTTQASHCSTTKNGDKCH